MWMILLHLQLAAGVSLPAPTNLSITSFNMEHTLSFLPGPLTPPSCRFAVETLHPRRKRLWTPVAGCSRLKAGRTCNLTRAFEDPFDQYQARVRGFVSNLTSRWTVSEWFQPLTDTVLGPPDVSVSGCGNCLLLQFNTSSDWRLRKMIGFYRELVVVVRRSRDGAQFSLNLRYQDNMVVTYLQPGVEYCVTVSVKTFFKSTSVASEPHCAFTSRPQHATTLYVACALVGAFCSLVLFLVGRVVCGGRLSSTLLKTLKSLVPGNTDAAFHKNRKFAEKMSATVSVLIGTLWALCGSTVVSAAVNRPANVTLTSNNMDLVLRWEPPEGAAAGVLYTTKLSSSILSTIVCVNISSTRCDLSRANISAYGSYSGWVKASLGEESSDWVNSNRVTPDMDTIIGPPNVTLLSGSTTMEVIIRDPKLAVSTLKGVYSVLIYNVTYWRDGHMDEARSINSTQHDRVVLSDLEVSTKYCVQVQIRNQIFRFSEMSRPVCESTSDKDVAPWVEAVVTFFVLAGAVVLAVLAVVYHSHISNFLCPGDALPLHLKEYLLAPPTSVVPVWNYSPPNEVFHQVSILSLDAAVKGGVEQSQV